MLVAEKMNRVSIVIMKEDMEAVLEEIAKAGVLHLSRIDEIDKWAKELESLGVEKLSNEYLKRQRKLQSLIEEISPDALRKSYGRQEEVSLIELSEIDDAVDKIEGNLEPLLSARRRLTERLSELRSILTQLEALIPSGLPVRSLMRSTFLCSAIGLIDEGQLTRLQTLLKSVPSMVFPYHKEGGELHVVCVVLRKDKAALDRSLRGVSFRETDLPEDLRKVSADIESKVTGEVGAHEEELAQVTRDIEAAREAVVPELVAVLRQVEAAMLLLRIRDYCKVTDRTCLFCGWVPREKSAELVSATKQQTGGRSIVDVVEAEDIDEVKSGIVEVPVKFKHPPFLRPFQMLISGYGIPSYRMIDPTIFVAVTFLIMFGMMFGDVGHGLVLLAAGIVLAARYKKFADVGKLVAYCGVSSVIFGILYGSLFGLETVLPTVWVKPLEGISDLFKVAIGLGVVVVSLGILLNVVNSLRTHSFLENFFDKSGPLVGVIYWAGVGIAVKFMMSSGRFPNPAIFFGLFIAPLVVFFLKGPILRVIGKRERAFPEGIATYVMEGLVEILEILMGYLANTVSFIRVAAFGLAHAGLFVAVFSLAEVVSSAPGGALLSWVVLVLGNILVILLEGLVVTIQAIRLQYYEFFGKFFEDVGSKYEPVSLVGSVVGSGNVKGGGGVG